MAHDARTNRTRFQARAIPVRGVRHPRTRRWRRTPLAALAISLVAFIAPALTLAPLQAAGPRLSGPQPADPFVPERPRRVVPVDVGAVASPAAAPSIEPVEVVAEGPQFQAALDAARATAKAWGVTFAAVRDGELIWAGASGTERNARTRLTSTSELVIGSVTKTYVAATILALVDERRVSLDDPVRSVLPELGFLSPRITIRQLLDHTSGLADVFNDTTRTGLETDPDHAWTAEELLDSLHAPWYQPGEGWAYANTNYFLLGLIVEQLTGRSLDEELADRYLRPLGLDATRILDGAAAPDGPLETAWTSVFWASGAMSATARDVARWGDALYRGDVLPPEARRSMLTFNDHEYGLGAQHIVVGPVDGVGHTGLLNTYTTLLFHAPEAGVTVALLVNRSHVDLAAMLRAEPADGPSLLELAMGDEMPVEPPPTPSPTPPGP